MDKILISVAPINASSKNLDAKKIASDVIECYKHGASMVHLHVRDKSGNLTNDLSYFQYTIELIKEKCDIIVEASTGGVSSLSIEERCMPLKYKNTEFASLNVGSMNLSKSVYINQIDDVKYCLKEIIKNKKIPEVEVFEIGMIETTIKLYEEFKLKSPILFNIVLGHNGVAPASIEALYSLRSFIPKNMFWGVTHFSRNNNDIIAAAISMGAKTIRVGFEDSDYIENEKYAKKNYELVKHFKNLLNAMGKEAMSVDEARNFFSVFKNK